MSHPPHADVRHRFHTFPPSARVLRIFLVRTAVAAPPVIRAESFLGYDRCHGGCLPPPAAECRHLQSFPPIRIEAATRLCGQMHGRWEIGVERRPSRWRQPISQILPTIRVQSAGFKITKLRTSAPVTSSFAVPRPTQADI